MSSNILAGTETVLPLPTIDEQVESYRTRLLDEAGLHTQRPAHFRRRPERLFTRRERERVTVICGGLSPWHKQLILAGLEGLGYNAEGLPTSTKADFHTGREYGNNGQCSPTYFTVGALVNYLKRLRDDRGIATQRILDDYVFFTAGACGPCRFGMYEAEYRLALRNAGFDGFRVLLFQQKEGPEQSAAEAGLEFDVSFLLLLLNAFSMGDLLREVAFHIRPYEVVPGHTDRVFVRCKELCWNAFRDKHNKALHGRTLASWLSGVVRLNNADASVRFLDQLWSTHYVDALSQCARLINDEIEVDYTQPKPIAKITGEYWAQTTEGDGNYHMFAFLEGEGAEVLVEPTTTWIAYMLNQARHNNRERRGLSKPLATQSLRDFSRLWKNAIGHWAGALRIRFADRALCREYERLRAALGGTAHALVDQDELRRLGHPYYHTQCEGGEGHLEVANNIYYHTNNLAHMVLSLKPFGCMPSTQSDGAQVAVLSDYPNMVYLPIETSGEGDACALSRVQMKLSEAKAGCREEFGRAVGQTGYSLDQIRQYVGDHRALRRPLQVIPRTAGITGRAANFVIHVGRVMDSDRSVVGKYGATTDHC